MAQSTPRLAHVPALDGLRGIAVLAVVLFHANWLTGGWVGVDVFFVLSGYLITRLLLAERAAGSISLTAFWGRRLKRLMPALLSLILVVAVIERWRGRLTGPTGARWEVAGALSYLSNWFRLRDGVGYWSNFGGPSLLDHVWSLAIEEQFYVLWPIIIVAATQRAKRVPGKRLIASLALATVALGGWSLWTFARTGDANRVYLGTDTRAVAIVLGAFVGAIHQYRGDRRRIVERLAGFVGAAWLGWALVDLGGLDTLTYRGGLLLCSAAAAALVWAIGGEPTLLGRALSNRPLRWLGGRSYGIYLWHWPVMVAANVARNELSPNSRRFLALAATALIAEASYRWLETPFRRRGLAAFGGHRRLGGVVGVAAALGAIVAVALPTGPSGVSAITAGEPLVIPTVVPAESITEAPVPTVLEQTRSLAGPTQLPTDRPARVLVVGDSVGWYFGTTLHDLQASLGLIVEVQAVPTCPPISVDVATRRVAGEVPSRYDPECRDMVASYRSVVETFRPDVVVMMFGGSLFAEYEIALEKWADACSDDFAPWFSGQVGQAIDDLSSTGALIAVATEANYREPSVAGDFPLLDQRSVCKNRLWVSTALAAAESGERVGLVDLGAWVCPTPGECLEDRLGIPLRPDGVHLVDWSAVLAWEWMAPQLFDPPPEVNGG